jgi:hypothetical protein
MNIKMKERVLLGLIQLCGYLLVDAISKRTVNRHPPGFHGLIGPKLEESLQTPVKSTFTTISSPQYQRVGNNIDRSRRTEQSSKTQAIRIEFITSPLEETIAKSKDDKTTLRGEAIINTVLPQLKSNFASSLKVVPTTSLSIPDNACFGYFNDYLSSSMKDPGIANRDLVIFVSAYENLGDVQLCNSDPKLSTLAVSSPCHVDSNDRPVIGFANICLNSLSVSSNNQVDEDSLLVMEDVLTHEFIHVLGLNSALFKYYRSAFDNKPLTPRRKSLFGSGSFETKTFHCVNNRPDQTLEVIADNTVIYKTEIVKTLNGGFETRGYYVLVLPTVAQVVRNQFNCSRLEGARLENQPTSESDCVGSHFDERYYFTDIMSALYDDDAAYFSPLTLALLEDSGWYKSDFKLAENSPFGLNMGCGFAEQDCIIDGKVPDHSRGFFCNNLIEKVEKCGPSHHYRGVCDLSLNQSPGKDYFGDSMGPAFTHADWCPLVRSFVTDCDNMGATKSDPIEVFDPDSRCMNVEKVDGSRTALCVRAYCNEVTSQFVFNVGLSAHNCGVKDEGKAKEVVVNGQLYKFLCPKLSQLCPE